MMDFTQLLKLFKGGNQDLVDQGLQAIAPNKAGEPNALPNSFVESNTHKQQSWDQYNSLTPIAQGIAGTPDVPIQPTPDGPPIQTLGGTVPDPQANFAQMPVNIQNAVMNRAPETPITTTQGVGGIATPAPVNQPPGWMNQPIPALTPEQSAIGQAPSPVQSPTSQMSPLEMQYQQIRELQNQPIKKEALWKDLLVKLAQVGQQIGDPSKAGQPIVGYGRLKREAELQREYAKLPPLEREAKIKSDLQSAEIARQDKLIDNARLEMVRQDRIAEAKRKSIDKAKETLRKASWFDPKNPAHIQWARDAGLDPAELEGWDNRKWDTKKIAGVTYVLKNGVFEPSNLPVDESETLTDYKVTVPGGETQIFKVSQKDAAKFTAQATALGMQIESRERENEKNRTHEEEMIRLRDRLQAARDAVQENNKIAAEQRDEEKTRRLMEELKAATDAYEASAPK